MLNKHYAGESTGLLVELRINGSFSSNLIELDSRLDTGLLVGATTAEYHYARIMREYCLRYAGECVFCFYYAGCKQNHTPTPVVVRENSGWTWERHVGAMIPKKALRKQKIQHPSKFWDDQLILSKKCKDPNESIGKIYRVNLLVL